MAEKKQELIGKVVSAKNDKTIIVNVETSKKHPLYHKIRMTRPLSKTKRYELVEVLVEAVIL